MLKIAKVEGLDEIQAKLDEDFLVQPELEHARDTIVERVERQGRGLGAKRNSLSTVKEPLGAKVTSTLNHPRTKGTSWGRKNESIFKSMSGRVVKKAIERIESRWSA